MTSTQRYAALNSLNCPSSAIAQIDNLLAQYQSFGIAFVDVSPLGSKELLTPRFAAYAGRGQRTGPPQSHLMP